MDTGRPADGFELEDLPSKSPPPPAPACELRRKPAPLIADFAGPLPTDDRIQPTDQDPIAEHQQDLIRHRLRADEAVRHLHLDHARAIHREVLVVIILLAAACASALSGPWIGLALAALALATLGVRAGRIPCLGIIVTWAVAAVIVGVLHPHRVPGRPSAGEIVAVLICVMFLPVLPLLHRWTTAPLPDPSAADGPDPTGDTGQRRLFTGPAELSVLHGHRLSVAVLNSRVKELRTRQLTLRRAVIGATGGALGCALAGFGSHVNIGFLSTGFGTSTWPGIAWVGIATGLAGWWIGWRRLGPLAALLIYAPVACGSYLVALLLDQVSFQVLIAIWVWVAWILGGAMLGLWTELAEDAAPQRTT